MLVLLTVFLSSGLISPGDRAAHHLPDGVQAHFRGAFLVARLLGNMLTAGGAAAGHGRALLPDDARLQQPHHPAHLAAVGMLCFELWVLSGVGFLMSSFSSQMVSASSRWRVLRRPPGRGHLCWRASPRAARLQALGKAVYYVLPDLSRFNYRPHATYYAAVSGSELLSAAGYGLAYTGVMVALAILLFNRRDFR